MTTDLPKSKAAVSRLLDAINREDYISISQKKSSKISSFFEVININTNKCFPWKYANRIKNHVNENTCEDLIDSIKANGQKIPAIARKVGDNYEIICGVRRLYSCKKLNIRIIITIANVTDRDAMLIMDAENRARVDISPYERAMDYRRWIDLGIYKNYREIQELTGIKKSWFSQLMSLSELNPKIVSLFGNPVNLKQKWGYSLKTFCKNPDNELKMLSLVPILINKKYSPISIYRKLVKSCLQDTKSSDEEIFTDSKNKILFKMKHVNEKTTITIKKTLNSKNLIKIKEALKSLLE